ncbi:MAG: threonylcarbamoyl-AMP synthase [Schwartzia sp.]|nr:threonylcarbamoyl-AMP synthase [Schwartzia sp. (in: firmicutes)]
MQTKLVKIRDIAAAPDALTEAAAILRDGGLVAFPTETVYGLGANGLDAAACAAIYAAKGRPPDNPLILHAADWEMVRTIARTVPPLAEKIMAAFCPGPVTLILPKKPVVPDAVTGGLDTVGVRLPDNDIARAMIRAAGVPIAAPSANLSGRPSPTTATAVLADMAGKIPLILDGGPCPVGVESTIVDATGDQAVILRPGAITREMLAEVCGPVALDPALADKDAVPRAPGMKYTHYAPKAPLTLIAGPPTRLAVAFRREIRRLESAGETVGLVVSRELATALADLVPTSRVAVYGRQGDLPDIAAHLYEALRHFDHQPATALLGEATATDGLGLAVMNRLGKASGGRMIKA